METPTKNQLIQDMEKSFQDTIDWINQQAESNFNEEMLQGKWTIAGHLYHLIKSTKAVSQGMLIPKAVLQTQFGNSNRPERNYEEMVEKYETTLIKDNVKAPSNFSAEAGRTFERETLINRFEQERNDLIGALGNWNKEEMSSYIMPHPAIGLCTIREFIYFTTLHTEHHLAILKEIYVK